MIKLGEKQKLTVVKKVDFGVYLAEADTPEDKVLLPLKEVPEGTDTGSVLEVFIYKDSEDRPVATVTEPLIMAGGTALLKVVQVTRIGAFLDWGLPKDLLLPFAGQTYRVKERDEVLVALYTDKSGRLAATMNVYPFLSCDPPYEAGDDVEALLYEKSDTFGIFAAVDMKYSAIIPRTESFGDGLEPGKRVRARVVNVRDDGKLNLSVRDKAYLQMEPDMEKILSLLDSYGGTLPFTEKADPEIIRRETGMSKNEFKRAVGHLYKLRKISLEGGIIKSC